VRSHLHRVARAHLNRPFSPPEIQRCALESVFLTLASLAPDGLLRPTDFPWLDRPEAVEESRALEALRGAGALDSIGDDYSLTPLGRALAGLPADLAPAKLLLLSALAGVLSAGAALAASLSLPSPLRPASGDAAAARAELLAPSGDPLTALACFGAWAAARNERRTDMRRWCRHRALDESRLSEMAKLHRQLQSAVLGRGGAAPLLLPPDGGSGSEGEAGGQRRPREAEAEEVSRCGSSGLSDGSRFPTFFVHSARRPAPPAAQAAAAAAGGRDAESALVAGRRRRGVLGRRQGVQRGGG